MTPPSALFALLLVAFTSVCNAVVGPGKVTGDTAVHDPSEFSCYQDVLCNLMLVFSYVQGQLWKILCFQ